MRLRAASQVTLQLMVALILGGLSPGLWADDVYLKEDAHRIQGRVVTEKEDVFVVEIPKDQIQRIERSGPLPGTQAKAADAVLWEENGDVVVLTVPRQMLHVVRKGTVDTAPVVRTPSQENTPVNEVAKSQTPLAPNPHLGGVVGRVLWDGQPAEGCRVKVVQVSRMDSLRLAARLLGVSEAEAAKETAVEEAVTDATGRYRIEQLVPGEYDIYWKPRGVTSWIRRLSERPDLLILAGEATTYLDIKAHVQTVN